MAAGLETTRLGGSVLWAEGVLLTSEDLNNTGGIALQSLCNLMAVLFHDDVLGVPRTGFPSGQESAKHCFVTADGALGFDLSTGVGWLYNASATADEFGPATYRPIVVGATYSASLDAHDSSPRIDLVCLAPAWDEDQPEDRQIKDPLAPEDAPVSTSVDTRKRFSYAVTVQKGTPATTPVAPSVPAGYVAVGRATVPATTGNAGWEDVRPMLAVSNALVDFPAHGIDGDGYVAPPLSGTLLVGASSPASMVLTVQAGFAVVKGRTFRVPAGKVTISTAPVSDTRIDVVYVNTSGALAVQAGTAAATPTVPSVTGTPLAQVLVGTGVSVINSGDITGVREYGPIGRTQIRTAAVGNSQVEAGSIQPDRLTAELVQVISTGVVSVSGNVATIGFDAQIISSGGATAVDSIQYTAEVFKYETDTSGAGEYGHAGAEDLDYIVPVPVNTLPTVALSVGTNTALTAGRNQLGILQCPVMHFVKTAGVAGDIKLRRGNSGVTGTFLVVIRPTSHIGTALHTLVTFS